MTPSGSPLDFMTAAAKATQPVPLTQDSQGMMTCSKTSTLSSATLLLTTPTDPIHGGGALQVEPPPPQATIVVDIPPLPGEMTSLATLLPPTKGATTDEHFDVSPPYILATHTQGCHTTPLRDAILHDPTSLPIASVNKFPLEFNSDHSRLDNRVMGSTHLVELDKIPADVAPSDCKRVPVMTVDPTSAQALLDNTWPAPDDLAFPPDPSSVRLWEFASKSCKLLDSALHSFRQEQTEHDQPMEAILQNLHADCLDPTVLSPTKILLPGFTSL
jgi:hypothetical protein